MIGELKQQRLVDDDGSDDVAKKNSLCPFKLYRVCSDPLNLSNVGNVVEVFFFFRRGGCLGPVYTEVGDPR